MVSERTRLGHRIGDRLRAKGFTLLEVMVALTITGMALGGLFGIIAGNKQLAWRSEQALYDANQIRSLINFSQLNDDRGELVVDFQNEELILSIDEEIEEPERKTQPMLYTLKKYEVLDPYGELLVEGSYWVKLDLPR